MSAVSGMIVESRLGPRQVRYQAEPLDAPLVERSCNAEDWSPHGRTESDRYFRCRRQSSASSRSAPVPKR
jgi:hypothetical protein